MTSAVARVDGKRARARCLASASMTGIDAAALLLDADRLGAGPRRFRRRCRGCRRLRPPAAGRGRRPPPGSRKRPPSAKLSGVTLTMPMMRGRSSARPAIGGRGRGDAAAGSANAAPGAARRASAAATSRRRTCSPSRSMSSAAAKIRSARPATASPRAERTDAAARRDAADRANVAARWPSRELPDAASRLSVQPPRAQIDGYGSAVRMPAGPPLVLMAPTFCSDRPVRPEKRMTLISSSTMHCTSRVLALEAQAMPWHQCPIGSSAALVELRAVAGPDLQQAVVVEERRARRLVGAVHDRDGHELAVGRHLDALRCLADGVGADHARRVELEVDDADGVGVAAARRRCWPPPPPRPWARCRSRRGAGRPRSALGRSRPWCRRPTAPTILLSASSVTSALLPSGVKTTALGPDFSPPTVTLPAAVTVVPAMVKTETVPSVRLATSASVPALLIETPAAPLPACRVASTLGAGAAPWTERLEEAGPAAATGRSR